MQSNDAQPLLRSTLLRLAAWLQAGDYRFTTVTPASHARVNARPGAQAGRTLRDAFGWSRPFPAALLPAQIAAAMHEARLLQPAQDGLLRSTVRFSTLGGQLFAHSAYPTKDEDAVFFGPDSYRFVDLIERELDREPLPAGARILDVGCGAGVGGIAAALACRDRGSRLALADINPQALRFAGANAAHAGIQDAEFAQGDLFAPLQGQFDLVVANPPYLNDASARLYRHGGGRWGEGLSERIVREGLDRLAPGGRLVLYTGVAIVDGLDPLLAAVQQPLRQRGWPWRYRELDPDVFGEELDEPAYALAERIAVTALVVQRPGTGWTPHLHPAMA